MNNFVKFKKNISEITDEDIKKIPELAIKKSNVIYDQHGNVISRISILKNMGK
jgi:hypothetical protein